MHQKLIIDYDITEFLFVPVITFIKSTQENSMEVLQDSESSSVNYAESKFGSSTSEEIDSQTWRNEVIME